MATANRQVLDESKAGALRRWRRTGAGWPGQGKGADVALRARSCGRRWNEEEQHPHRCLGSHTHINRCTHTSRCFMHMQSHTYAQTHIQACMTCMHTHTHRSMCTHLLHAWTKVHTHTSTYRLHPHVRADRSPHAGSADTQPRTPGHPPPRADPCPLRHSLGRLQCCV